MDFEEVRVSAEAPEDDVHNAIMAIRRNGVAIKGEMGPPRKIGTPPGAFGAPPEKLRPSSWKSWGPPGKIGTPLGYVGAPLEDLGSPG